MEIDYKKFSIVCRISVICLAVLLDIYFFIESDSIVLFIIASIILILIIILILLYDKMLIELSEMLESIMNTKEDEDLPVLEDTIFSKLKMENVKRLRMMKSQNERIENEKSEIKHIISDICHQLKTPMANIKMYNELLLDNNLSDEEKGEFRNAINISLDKLTFLIEDMTKMSRLEGNVISLRQTCTSLNNTIYKALFEVNNNAAKKNIVISFDDSVEIKLLHDVNWTCEALFNILDNAVKYTQQNGSIMITTIKYDMFSRIDIADNGIGIIEEDIPKVFQRFYRGVNVSEAKGIGIGLYLSRKIITEQNGYIKVSSKGKNMGSTFSVFLPNIVSEN